MIKSRVKLKKECFKCTYFNKKAGKSFKCAVKWSCPGLNWDEKRKQRAIKNHKSKSLGSSSVR